MQRPDFWADKRNASRVSSEHRRAKRRLDRYLHIESEVNDAQAAVELASEAMRDDSITAAEFLDESWESLNHTLVDLSRLEEERLFSGEYDDRDAILTIHPGAGGTESQDWAEMLLRMYLRWADKRGFKTEINEATGGDEAGIKSATVTFHGENAYGLLSAERGVHRLVRISPFDAANRRHTSFAAVEVSPLVEEDVEVEIDEKDLRIETYRASGAGGQHVNKTDSAVRITHLPTGVVVQCQNERSQITNRNTAMKLLKAKLLEMQERQRAEEMEKERGEVMEIAWGSQIRSYVLAPYQMVKDHRTGYETGNTQAVLNGDIDDLIHKFLVKRAGSA
ncbi:MAG: peptide chain release factor 2 [Thermoleophilia bacterium]|nr:peptide chain release factor 2 [Thermoleophilia bacterium]